MIVPKSNFFPAALFFRSICWLLILISTFHTLGAQPTAVLSNPSNCGLNIPLTDFNCPENVNFYNPDVFEIEVVNAPGTLLGVDVFLQEIRLLVEHTWVSDMNFALRSPSGQVVQLFGNIGGNGDNFGDTSLVACTGAMVLRLGACSSIKQGEAPFVDGPYRAMQDFYAFNDLTTNPNGTWELLICDDLDDDTGVLQYVELVFAPLSCLPIQDVILLSQDTTSATFTYQPTSLCGPAIVEVGPPGFIPGTDENPGQGQVFTVACPPFTLTGLAEDTDYDIYLRRSCDGGAAFSDNSCVSAFQTGCNPAPVTAVETFDGTTNCAPLCGSVCSLNSSWRNVPGDNFDWLSFSGATPTLGTGPNDDITGGGKYLYIEANGTQCPAGGVAYLQSPCLILDKMGSDSCHVSFSYHMSGINIGTLRMSASDDGGFSWTELWHLSGKQDTSWQRAYVSLADYPDGTNLQLRLEATKGNGIFGDIAIDQIQIHGSQVLDFPSNLLYVDADADGYGKEGIPIYSCLDEAPAGYAFNNLDCNDNNPDAYPGAPEIPCNGIDENCNAGMVDDDSILPVPAVISDTVCSGVLPTISALADPDFQVLWYETPDRSEGFVWVGNEYRPVLPANTTAFPQVYTYYAEVTNFVCTTPVLGEATVTVLPVPEGEVVNQPATCPGEAFDLASADIVDNRFTGATLSFHSASPANGGNELPSTVVSIAETTTYTYLLTSQDNCTDEGQVTLSLREAPQINFSPADSFSLCLQQRDTVFATVTGGEAPYTFLWENGRTTPNLPVMAATIAGTLETYPLRVTDAAGCFVMDTLLLRTTNSIDSLRAFTTPVSTCEGADGSITIVPLNGLPPFSYQWEDETGGSGSGMNVMDSIKIINLPQNAYRVTITDNSADGCEVLLRNLRIQGPGFQLAETSLTAPTCAGFDDGEICLDVTGSGTITYNWSDGQDTPCASNLAAGEYSVTISNGECTTVESYLLEAPDSLQLSVIATSPSCADATDGNLQISAYGGTANYTYLWDNGFIIPQRINLGLGNYLVTVTDSKGCVLLDSIELLGPAPVAITMDSLEHVSCPGLNDGLVILSGEGGTSPYQFLWANGSTSPLRIGLTVGTYSVTMTDFQGCTTSMAVAISEPDPLSLSLQSMEQPVCRGDETGSLTLAVVGGQAPYQYLWSDGLMTTNPARENLPVGAYEVVVQDANACLSDTLSIVLDPASDLTLNAVLTSPACVGLSNGTIQVNAGGQMPHLYNWSNGASTATLNNLPVGDYSLTVTDDRGCIADTTFSLTADQVFTINSTVIQPSCFGVNDGIIDQTLIEQGQPPFQFFWAFNNTNHVDQMFLGPGNYQFSVTDALGCRFVSDTFQLAYPAPLTLAVVDSVGIACTGDDNGFLETAASGGTAPYNYNWLGTGNTTNSIANLSAGDYLLSVTDARGCELDTVLSLSDPPALMVGASLELGNVCDPEAIDVLSSQVLGGSQPYDYNWSDRSDSPSIVNPEPGDYFLTITDGNGCVSIFGTIKVRDRVEPLVLDSFVVQQVSCFQGNDAQLTAYTSGGSEMLRYHFTPTYIAHSDSNVVSVSGLSFDNYYSVTVTDIATGCEVQSGNVPGQQPTPISIERDSFSVVNCFGGADGSIYVSVEGGTGPYSYLWTNEEGTTVSTQEDHRFAQAGFYELLVTDTKGCTAIYRDSNVVSINDLIILSDTLINSVTCRGGTNGAINVEVSGGVPPFSYEWSNNAQTEDIMGLAAGIYTLTVTDSDTCRAIFPGLRVRQPLTELLLDGTSEDVSCFGFNDGSITSIATGGDEPYSYRWRRNGILVPTLQGPVLENLIPAEYQLSLTDSNGCVRQLLFDITSPPPLEVMILNEPLGADSLTALVEGGVPPYSYLWSNSDTTMTINGLASAFYEVMLTDSEGCTSTATFLLTGVSDKSANFSNLFQVYPNPTSGALRIVYTGEQRSATPTLELFNPLGQLIQSFQLDFTDRSFEIDLGTLPSGRYALRIWEEQAGRYWVQWVVKM
ncbi:T9SS type A sorting domain-containing protein [Lewinella sp. LCG006]|uniref:T9SS type A sorting domain-containing protein n=1 Tax=Lewinella sp. LCG006 TaxID=3231911 RepID=UPI00345FC4E8